MVCIRGDDRIQVTFMMDGLEDYISGENPLRITDAFINSLNF